MGVSVDTGDLGQENRVTFKDMLLGDGRTRKEAWEDDEMVM